MAIRIDEQIRILMEYGEGAHGKDAHGKDDGDKKPTLRQLAAQIGISDQALKNLLDGKSANPRLKTLLALTRYYQISLDYFSCQDEEACKHYFYRNPPVTHPLIAEINMESAALSAKGQRNVLAIMTWMLAGHPMG
ncbi:MAG: hypothetical protein CL607_01175 [Anaerolineaceae bacterium]|nr:hypothetical protein [Anaerolineaceae bacterium]